MILVDSSVWINHLRRPDPALQRLLLARRVIVHPFVIGELACGSIGPRAAMLAELQKLPSAPRASDVEALELIESRRLMARGIGYLDIHLLASTLLSAQTQLWTADRQLGQAASDLSIAWNPS
jgi:predicted nucleic acid-binding protein